PQIPRHVQPVPLAAARHPVGAVPAGDGGPAILLPAQHRLGRSDGLPVAHHDPRSRLLPRPATRLHHLDRHHRHQGLTRYPKDSDVTLALDDEWIWDFWLTRKGVDWHIYFLKAPKSLGDPELRHRNVTQGYAVSRDLRHAQLGAP